MQSYTGAVQAAPLKLDRRESMLDMSCGDTFSLGLTESGQLLFWGQDLFSNKVMWGPKPIKSDVRFKSVSAGRKHCAAVSEDGMVYTWGSQGGWFSSGGYLGISGATELREPTLVDAFKAYGAEAKSVICTSDNTFILTTDGEVLGCGSGEYGRLGTGGSGEASEPYPVEALANEDIVQLAAGPSHSLALTADGRVFCWGRNDTGQLGLEDSFFDIYSMEEIPRQIPESSFGGENNSSKIVKIAAGKNRSAAVTEDGRGFSWGHRVYHVPKQILMSPELPAGHPNTPFITDIACGGEQGKSFTSIVTKGGYLWTVGVSKSAALGVPDQPKQDMSEEEKKVREAAGDVIGAPIDIMATPRLVYDPLLPTYKVVKPVCGDGSHAGALVIGRG